MSKSESDGSNKRRRSSTRSYPSRARVGSAPPVHSAAYEEELQRYGIVFDDLTTKDLLTDESKDLCQALLGLDEPAPAYNSCSEKMYIEIFQRASKCNEERVRRDLTPHIVPSAELLYLVDGETTLENVREEMSGDWTKCSLLGGTQPRPDYAYGCHPQLLLESSVPKWKTTRISTTPPSSRNPCNSRSSCARQNAERRTLVTRTEKTFTAPASPSMRSFSCAELPEKIALKEGFQARRSLHASGRILSVARLATSISEQSHSPLHVTYWMAYRRIIPGELSTKRSRGRKDETIAFVIT